MWLPCRRGRVKRSNRFIGIFIIHLLQAYVQIKTGPWVKGGDLTTSTSSVRCPIVTMNRRVGLPLSRGERALC